MRNLGREFLRFHQATSTSTSECMSKYIFSASETTETREREARVRNARENHERVEREREKETRERDKIARGRECSMRRQEG